MSGPLSSLTAGLHRLQARRAEARTRQRMRELTEGRVFLGLAHAPEPRDFGDFAAARAALDGTLVLGGIRRPLRGLTPWELELPSEPLTRRLHGFGWLDDMAGLSGKAARARAQAWALGWIDRFGDGTGPGWAPACAGQRLRRLLVHLPFLEKGLDAEPLARLQTTLPQHAAFLAGTWAEESDDLARLKALSGLAFGAVCLTGLDDALPAARDALRRFAQDVVSDKGGIACRRPSALLRLFRELLHLRALFAAAAQPPLPELEAAIARIAPSLRALRLGDGTLPRFHGGGPGPEGALDRALADAGSRARPRARPAMGFVRLHGGRTQVTVDCARPPGHEPRAHASTLGFEMSSGRQRIVVNVGPALPHLADWARAPRTTAAHNTLALDKTSSSRFAPPRAAGRPELDALQARPSMVSLAQAQDITGMWIQARHDGYLEDYGLLHERRLFVGALGEQVHGEDVLLSPDQKARRRFLARIKGAAQLGVGLSVHFHLHPDVEAELMRSTDSVRLHLPNGEVWLFRHQGGLMDVETGAYLDADLPEPRAARQIVVRGRATSAAAEISWSLVRQVAAPRPAPGRPR
ncbi:heparinase [Rhodobacteraceae bacterium 2CG4]|uniref:Heparinase n=1 Tax=Halovulum marinum TaxID=2662447 RepID=A0A6L5Z5S9_9RHOB|nr:heparinase II/III family protein [Halovulum marinum]MSU91352.1 heparinase [Halovulum marinum]